MSRALKSAMTVAEQVQLLRSRGMVTDDGLAHQWLSSVSYYRLSAYWYPARVTDGTGKRTDLFKEGTTFEDAVLLYEADRKLRTLVHDGMERVEIALRTRVGEHLCLHGPLSYVDAAEFRPTFDHEYWLDTARRRISRAARHNEAIKHYRSEYGQFPFWVLAEVLDFSDVSRLYEGLPARAQHEIAEEFGIRVDLAGLSKAQRARAIKQPPLVRWMEQLTIIRNTCAHHGRLWNKSFTPAPTAAMMTQPGFELLPLGQSERLFGALIVMARLLQSSSPGTAWPDKVAHLIEDAFLSNPLVVPEALGIPENWNHGF